MPLFGKDSVLCCAFNGSHQSLEKKYSEYYLKLCRDLLRLIIQSDPASWRLWFLLMKNAVKINLSYASIPSHIFSHLRTLIGLTKVCDVKFMKFLFGTFTSTPTNVVVQKLNLLLRIQQVPGSNLGLGPSRQMPLWNLKWGHHCFLSHGSWQRK